MHCSYSCHSPEHLLARRSFLGSLALGGAGLGGGIGLLTRPALAEEIAKQGKRVLLFMMAGGLSQLESWDPKPGTKTGGPCRAIPTSVPGVHLSELLPKTAMQMHHLAVIRSINTKEDDHGKGRYLMETGHRQSPATDYPKLGAVVAKAVERADSPLPGHIRVTNGGGSRGNDSAFLGAKYASFSVAAEKPLRHSQLPGGLTEEMDRQRNDLRRRINDRFASRRRSAQTDAYTFSYEQALKVMQSRDVFSIEKEPQRDHERYGGSDLGKHCLLARRLLEHDIPFVQVTHSNYDTHNENFTFHIEQLAEFDQAFATTVADLADRGMLDSTLVVVMSEFGRTPRINRTLGRDHWSRSWSVCLGGAGIQPGAVIGKTNDEGTEVVDREVDHRHLFHTYLEALNLDSTSTFDIAGKEVPLADPSAGPIRELLT